MNKKALRSFAAAQDDDKVIYASLRDRQDDDKVIYASLWDRVSYMFLVVSYSFCTHGRRYLSLFCVIGLLRRSKQA